MNVITEFEKMSIFQGYDDNDLKLDAIPVEAKVWERGEYDKDNPHAIKTLTFDSTLYELIHGHWGPKLQEKTHGILDKWVESLEADNWQFECYSVIGVYK